MADKKLLGRIVHKHDTAANWAKALTFIPMKGEIIVYDIDDNYTYERFKIGDGITLVSDLPFSQVQSDWKQTDETQIDFIKNKPDVMDALAIVAEAGLAVPIVADDGSAFVDENGAFYTLI